MNVLSGKKLLVLGGTADEISLVQRAQELGIYVIVANYHVDRTLSPAKNVADEAWDVSWADIDVLEQMCRDANVNGVLAGYSEIRVDCMMQLCARLGLPCYITEEQLEITRNKIKFKNACRASGVPVVHEYDGPRSVDKFPVIVKPTDRAGSIGVGVATNAGELERAYRYAMEKSIRKQVIIEDFIMNATKFDCYYQILGGEIRFVNSNDVISAKDNGFERVVQSAWLLPSIHQSAFIKKIDPAMRDMIRSMGIQNGYIFFSGFVNKEEEFVFFECGFRLCGGHFYYLLQKTGGWNTLDMLIYHALTGSAKPIYAESSCDPDLKCASINLYAKSGTIHEIGGMDKIAEMDACEMALTKARIGQVCTDDTAILSKLGLIHFFSHSADELGDSAEKMYAIFSATDEEGNDMVYDRVDSETIRRWWDTTP